MKKALGITFAVIGGVIVLLIVLGVALTAAGVKTTSATSPPATATHHASQPHTTAPAAPATPATPAANTEPTVDRQVNQVLFVVKGYAPDGVDITYGSDSDNRSPAGTLGPLGDGVSLPWKAVLPYHENALYYSVNAQLQGSGDIRCYLKIKVTNYYSDGTHLSRSKVVEQGHASGSYNICDAQAS